MEFCQWRYFSLLPHTLHKKVYFYSSTPIISVSLFLVLWWYCVPSISRCNTSISFCFCKQFPTIQQIKRFYRLYHYCSNKNKVHLKNVGHKNVHFLDSYAEATVNISLNYSVNTTINSYSLSLLQLQLISSMSWISVTLELSRTDW